MFQRMLLVVFALCAPTYAAIEKGAEAGTLANQAAQVDQYLRTQMERARIPGMAVAVVKGDYIVLLKNYGTASEEFAVPVHGDTAFSINSITKAFTGVAALRLVQQGRLDLSAQVGRYLSDLPPAWRGVTIRQLLSHMSGLPDIMRAPTVETDATAAWSWVQARPVISQPGERFQYCQTNYTLIQRVVNQIEGRALDAPLADEQIRLAGMTRTAYGDASTVMTGRAPTYRWLQGGVKVMGYRSVASTVPDTLGVAVERFLPFRRASSGLNSTAEDMARWIIAIQNGELLNAQSLTALWTPVAFNNGELGQWGLGWQVLARGSHQAVGMTGGGRAAFYIYPDDKVAVVILTNLAGAFPEDMVDKIASIYAPELDISGVPALRIALEERGYAQALPVAAEIERQHPALVWPELEMNDWGYRLLSNGRPREALEVFRLIASRFPNSANAHDSLAQALWVNEDLQGALLHYQRVLELSPAAPDARKHVEELEARLR